MNGNMPQKAHGGYPLMSSTTQSQKSITNRRDLNKALENIEHQFSDKYRKHYKATKAEDEQVMNRWKNDIRKSAPKENTEAVLKFEDELWNS